MIFSVYTSVGAMMSTVFSPYGYTPIEVSVSGLLLMVSGIIASFVSSKILDKHSKYILIYRIICISSCIFTATSIYTVPAKNLWVLGANLIILGASIIPVKPIGFSFSIELSYPVSEAMSNGTITFIG